MHFQQAALTCYLGTLKETITNVNLLTVILTMTGIRLRQQNLLLFLRAVLERLPVSDKDTTIRQVFALAKIRRIVLAATDDVFRQILAIFNIRVETAFNQTVLAADIAMIDDEWLAQLVITRDVFLRGTTLLPGARVLPISLFMPVPHKRAHDSAWIGGLSNRQNPIR
jgi:hypothetical protein